MRDQVRSARSFYPLKFLIDMLFFVALFLASGAIFQVIKDGGAREEGPSNAVVYDGVLNIAQPFWFLMSWVAFVFVLATGKRRLMRPTSEMFLLLTYIFLPVFWADDMYLTLRLATIILTVYVVILCHISRYGKERSEKIITIFFQLVVVLSVFFIIFLPKYAISVGQHSGAWQGIFDHKNALGAVASVSMLWLMYKKKWVLFFLSVFLVLGSRSLTGIVAALVGFGVYSFSPSRLKAARLDLRNTFSLIVLIILIALSGFALYSALEARELIFGLIDSTFSGRDMIWRHMYEEIQMSPWWGVGLDQLYSSNKGGEVISAVGFMFGSAHNGFLETFYALGWFGVFLCVVVVLRTALRGGKNSKLISAFLSQFIVINTFESKMIGFNVLFILLMYFNAASNEE